MVKRHKQAIYRRGNTDDQYKQMLNLLVIRETHIKMKFYFSPTRLTKLKSDNIKCFRGKNT